MDKTLILLKPDCLKGGHVGEVINRFEKNGFKIIGLKMLNMSSELLSEHYSHVSDQPFFPNLVEFMSSTPVVAMVLKADRAVERGRELLGATDPKAAKKGTIRADFGVDKMVNVAHASDSVESAHVEIRRFFEMGEVTDWIADASTV